MDMKLTGAEHQALQAVSRGGGKASWYQVARLVTPAEFPGEDTNAVKLLGRLEGLGLVEKVPGGGQMQWYAVTATGADQARLEPAPSP